MNSELEKAMVAICGAENVRSDEKSRHDYGKDWTHQPQAMAQLVVFPRSTEAVSKIMQYCSQHKVRVIPSGGRTGLAGGAVALQNELVLSLDRMNQILRLDTTDMSVEVEAGVTTQAVQEEAKKHGVFFALDLAAKGSSQIGGNIATNAGGLKLIKYGGMREQVLGLEVVLADGTILDLNRALRKNNSGLDLRQLFIGSEGSLGIITKATLRLCPPPKDLELACLGMEQFAKIPELLALCSSFGQTPTAFEFFDQACFTRVLSKHSQLKDPFTTRFPYYVILEMEKAPHGDSTLLEQILEKAFEKELVADGVVASGSKQFQELWAFRENISESLSSYRYLYKNDISVAIGHLTECVAQLENTARHSDNQLKLYLFGHIGDGNIHLNYGSDDYANRDEFLADKNKLEDQIFAMLSQMRGSISAEHGIGLLKKNHLSVMLSLEEMNVMRQIKKTLDPHLILNPGKILPS